MEDTINAYQCPACTGPPHFAAGSGKLECEYCGNSYEVAEVEAFYARSLLRPGTDLPCLQRGTKLQNPTAASSAEACSKI